MAVKLAVGVANGGGNELRRKHEGNPNKILCLQVAEKADRLAVAAPFGKGVSACFDGCNEDTEWGILRGWLPAMVAAGRMMYLRYLTGPYDRCLAVVLPAAMEYIGHVEILAYAKPGIPEDAFLYVVIFGASGDIELFYEF